MSYPQAMVSADFNGDGYNDLATTQYNAGTVTVLLGNTNGAGGFTNDPASPITLAPGVGPIAAGVLQLSNTINTDWDLVVGNQEASTITILQGLGDGVFVPGTPINTDCTPTGIVTGDFNADTIPDIAVSESCDEVQIFLGQPSGGFAASPLTVAMDSGAAPAAIASGGFQPGTPSSDYLYVLQAGTATVAVLKWNGTTFQPVTGSPFASGESGNGAAQSLAVGDFNGDGNPDVAVGFEDAKVAVLLGAANGTLSAPVGPTEVAPPNTQILDLAAGHFTSGKYEGLAAAGYWQGGGLGTGDFADWVAVMLGSSTGALSPASGSPYELGGVAGPLVTGAFADGVSPPQAGDDIAATDANSCNGDSVVTLVNENGANPPPPPGNVFPADGCKIAPPQVMTGPVTSLSLTGATLTGTIQQTQGSPITSCMFRYGIGALSSSAPCARTLTLSGNTYTAQLTGLRATTTYEYQLVASSAAGTGTGQIQTFETCAKTSIPADALPEDSKKLDIQGCFTLGPVEKGVQTYVATGSTVKVNGLYFEPASGSTITIDPSAPALRATGAGVVKLGGVVPVWAWAAAGGLDVPLSGTINLVNNQGAKVFGLPIQGSLAATFQENEARLTGSVTLSFTDTDVTASLGVITDNDTGIAGATFAVKGADEAPGYSELQSCNVDKQPPTGFYCASITERLSSGSDYTYSGLIPKVPAIVKIGPIGIEDLEGSYDGAQHEWSAKGAFAIGNLLPGEASEKIVPTLQAGATFHTSPFGIDGFSAGDSNLNWHVGPATITEISLSLKLHPHFGISGGAGIETEGGWGIDGGFDFETGENAGWALTIHGSASLSIEDTTITIGGFLELDFRDGDHKVALGGSWSRNFGPASVSLGLSGGIDWPHWELDGNGSASVFGLSASVNGIVSDAGVGACGQAHVLFATVEIGFKLFWGGDTDWNSGCDFSGLSTVGATAPSGARDSAAGRSVTLKRGMRLYEFAAVGATGPPAVTLRGPHGVSLSTPATADHITPERHGFALAVTGSKTTYLIVERPPAGRWTITPAGGTPAPVRYEVAKPLMPLRIHARVIGSGRHRTLRWSYQAQPGTAIRFIQTGAAEETVTRTARGAGGARFSVAAGPAGTRHVVAIVSIDGIPRQLIRVARFRAPATVLPAVARASYRVRRGKLTVTWSRVGRATGYEVTLRLSSQSPTYLASRSARSLTLPLTRGVKVRRVTVTVLPGGAPVSARANGRAGRRSGR